MIGLDEALDSVEVKRGGTTCATCRFAASVADESQLDRLLPILNGTSSPRIGAGSLATQLAGLPGAPGESSIAGHRRKRHHV